MEPSKEMSVWKRITDDFKQKELLKLKLLFFVHTSTQSVLYPYLTVFMGDLGINTEEIGILAFTISCLGILLSPMIGIIGIISDRVGNFKRIVAVIMIMGGCTSFLLLLVPKARIMTQYPEELTMSINCVNDDFSVTPSEGELCYQLSRTANSRHGGAAVSCDERKTVPYASSAVMLDACGVMCTNNNSIEQGLSLMRRVRNYTVNLTEMDEMSTSHQFAITGEAFSPAWSAKTGVTRIFDNTVQAFNSSLYFFPTPGFLRYGCDNGVCSIGKVVDDSLSNPSEKTRRLGSLSPLIMDHHSAEFIINIENGSKKLRCVRKAWEKVSVTVHLNLANNTSSELLTVSPCQPHCIARVKRTSLCNETKIQQEINVPLSLYSCLAARVAMVAVSGTSLALVEGAIISVLRMRNADYGLQHVYASIGGMVAGQASGLLIDAFSTGKRRNYRLVPQRDANSTENCTPARVKRPLRHSCGEHTNQWSLSALIDGIFSVVRPAFYLYAVLKFISAIIMWNIDLNMKTPAKRVLSDIANVLKKVEVIGLLTVCFIYGICNGVIETYLFPYLRSLDATTGLLGSTIFVGKLFSIPFIILSGPILEYFGHAKVLLLSFIIYAIRFAGYSFIGQAWQCLFFEIMEAISPSLAIIALITYAAKLSNTRTDTTIQALIGGLYHGLGKGIGSLCSSYLIKHICYRNTFRLCGGVTVILSIVYFLFYRYYSVPAVPVQANDDQADTSNGVNALQMKPKEQVNTTFVTD